MINFAKFPQKKLPSNITHCHQIIAYLMISEINYCSQSFAFTNHRQGHNRIVVSIREWWYLSPTPNHVESSFNIGL